MVAVLSRGRWVKYYNGILEYWELRQLQVCPSEQVRIQSVESLYTRQIRLERKYGHDHGHEWPTATSFVQCQSALPFWDTIISKFYHENPWSRSSVWSKVKVTFDLQNSKVKVMVKFKPIGHIWGLEFNRYVCFLFRGSRTIFGWDIANFIFDLEKSRSRSWRKLTKI